MKLVIKTLSNKDDSLVHVDLEFWGQGSKAGAAFLESKGGDGKTLDRVLLQVNSKGQISLGKKREDL